MTRKAGRTAEEAADGPWLDPAEAGPRLLLFAPPSEEILASGAVAGLVLPPAAAGDAVAPCQRHKLALLVKDDAAFVEGAQLDGVHLTDAARVAEARRALGRARLIGAECGMSRHAAMVAGEAGADYVMFGSLDLAPPGAVIDLVAWWHELFVLPCAAAGRFSPATARTLAEAGADFLATPEADAALAEAILAHGSP